MVVAAVAMNFYDMDELDNDVKVKGKGAYTWYSACS